MGINYTQEYGATCIELAKKLNTCRQRICLLHKEGRLREALKAGCLVRRAYRSKYRRAYGYTIHELSHMLGVRYVTIARWHIYEQLSPKILHWEKNNKA